MLLNIIFVGVLMKLHGIGLCQSNNNSSLKLIGQQIILPNVNDIFIRFSKFNKSISLSIT